MKHLDHRSIAPLLALLLAVFTLSASAATRYVTDELRISVRSGRSNEYRIIEVIGSGARVETLQTAGEWVQVRTPEGNTGWVRAQYLTERRVAADRLADTRRELEAARERIAELEQSLEETGTTSEALRERNESLQTRIETLEEKLAQASRGLELRDENERLQGRAADLRQRVESLQEETQQLADRRRREWFMIGAGVVVGGMLFGMLVTRIPWRRRRDRMF